MRSHMNFNEYINYEEFETKYYEFKEIVSHKNYEKWAKTITAFANTNGGKLFFGVDDDENAIGIEKEQIKQDILYINDICDKKIHPSIKYDFNKIKLENGKFILELIVYKNLNLPVWLTRNDEQDVIYIRRDGESVIAHSSQIEELVLASKRKPFDREYINKKYYELSFNDLTKLYQENNDTNENINLKILKSFDAVSLDDAVSNGLLLFSDNCKFNNSNITCRIWPGLSKGSSKMIDKKTFTGNIPNLLDFARNYISLYTKRGLIKLNGEGRTNIISYPARAIEEALINAVSHRDYYIDGTQIDIDIFADRIQITSPGNFLLPGNAQDYQMKNIPSKRRNEIICKILELCNLMESSGTGFDKIVYEYEKYDEKFAPSIYSDPAQFIITLKDLTYKEKNIKKILIPNSFEFKSPKSGNREFDRKILEFCLDSPKSRQEIQNYLELTDRKNFIYGILNPLLDAELILTTQKSVNAPNQKYYTNKDKLIFN